MSEGTLVVFDSNVLIPMIIPASFSARLFLRLQTAGWTVISSPHILAEVEEKLRTKATLRRWMNVTDADIDHFLGRLPTICSVVAGNRQAHGAVPADPKDDIIIAAALEANAGYIVSEDRHLLDLNEYQGIVIMDREGFAAELSRLGA